MMDTKHCAGCSNNFYNGRENFEGGNRCWNLGAAKLIMRKEVHIDQRPPWTQPARRMPDCYSRSRYIYVSKDRKT